MRFLKAMAALILMATPALANNDSVIKGRWSFLITSGDSAQQLSWYPTIFETVLTQSAGNNPTVAAIPAATGDWSLCDNAGLTNVTASGSVQGANIDITFFVHDPTGGQGAGYQWNSANFNYHFQGKYQRPRANQAEIVGTYTSNAPAYCTNGSGSFIATWYPDLTGATMVGAMDVPAGTPGPTTSVPIVMNPKTNADFYTIGGSITIANLTDGHGNSCFAEPTLTIVPASGAWINGVWTWSSPYQWYTGTYGMLMEITAVDSLGRYLSIDSFPVGPDGGIAAFGWTAADGYVTTTSEASIGTNNSYNAVFGVAGGPCDGFGYDDAPFVTLPGKSDKGHQGHQRGLHKGNQ